MAPMVAASAAQAGIGAIQMLAGMFSRPKKAPAYEIPNQFNQNIHLAQTVKNQGMSGSEYARGFQNIMRNQNFALSALGNRRMALAGVGNIVQRTNDATLGLDVAAAKIKQQNTLMGTQMEVGANKDLADQRIQKMQWEKLQPYLRKMQSAEAMMGAGLQNIGSAGSMFAQSQMGNKLFPAAG
ncbi:MAG: hypothetical protein WCF67_15090 [Chitinophagaceae bacterium]